MILARAEKILQLFLGAAALWYLLAFLYVVLFSFTYPFGLEWLEGHVMEMVSRVRYGEALYVKPSLDYVPFIYTPLYYYVTGIIAKLTGVNYETGRLVSALATLGASFILYLWAREIGANRGRALIAAGLYLAAYNVLGRWYDLARVDNLYVMLLFAGCYMLYTYRGTLPAIMAGALLAMAYYTKQSAVMTFAPFLLWAMFMRRRDGVLAALAAAVCITGLVVASNTASDGWYGFYTWDVPAGHGVDKKYLLGFFTEDLLGHWWPMMIVASVVAVVLYHKNRALFYCFLMLGWGFVGGSYMSRIHWGGHVNVLMPMVAFFALVAALKESTPLRPEWKLILSLLLAVQFSLLHYSPNRLLPNDSLLDNNLKAIEEISALKGTVFIPEMQFIHWPDGEHNYVFGMAAFDVLRSDNPNVAEAKAQLKTELYEAFRDHRFDHIMPGVLVSLPDGRRIYRQYSELRYAFIYPSGLVRRQPPRVYSCC